MIWLLALSMLSAEPDFVLNVTAEVRVTNPMAETVWISAWFTEVPIPIGPQDTVSFPMSHEVYAVKCWKQSTVSPPCTSQPTMAQRFDADGDNDVDVADMQAFQACFNGPNRPPACK